MKNIELSIIVPTYKRTESLEVALKSIKIACHDISHEIIVIDDCEEGTAFHVVMKYQAQYLCKAGLRRGLSVSRNLGIKMSRGQYLAFLDDDDEFILNSITSLYSAAKLGNDFVYGNYISRKKEGIENVIQSEVSYDRLLIGNKIPVGSYIINKSIIKGLFDEKMRSHEDWEFLLNNLEGHYMKYVDTDVVVIEKRNISTTSMQARRESLFWLDYMAVYARYPAPHLEMQRKAALLTKGIDLMGVRLNHTDII